MVTALVGTRYILAKMTSNEWWNMPPLLATRVVKAILRSKFSRAQNLKWHLAVMQSGQIDFDYFFAEVFTPREVIAMFEDLHLEGALTRQDASHAQDCALRTATRHGTWMSVESNQHSA